MPLPNIQARESSLNQAILELARTEFVFGPYDPRALVLESCGPYYADEVAFWMGAELITGREEALARLADSLEPMYTFLEMGTMTVESFQVALTMKDPRPTRKPLGAAARRTVFNRGTSSLANDSSLEERRCNCGKDRTYYLNRVANNEANASSKPRTFFPKMSGDVATPKFPQTVVILSTGISLGSARGKPLVDYAASHICLPGWHSASLQRRRIKLCWTPPSAAISSSSNSF